MRATDISICAANGADDHFLSSSALWCKSLFLSVSAERIVKPDGRRGRGKTPRHALEEVSSDEEACKKAR